MEDFTHLSLIAAFGPATEEVAPTALSILAAHTDVPFEVILAPRNGVSPEALRAARSALGQTPLCREVKIARALSPAYRFASIPASLDRAAQAASGSHLVLLLGPPLLTPGWATKLLRVLQQAPAAGAAAPVGPGLPGVQHVDPPTELEVEAFRRVTGRGRAARAARQAQGGGGSGAARGGAKGDARDDGPELDPKRAAWLARLGRPPRPTASGAEAPPVLASPEALQLLAQRIEAGGPVRYYEAKRVAAACLMVARSIWARLGVLDDRFTASHFDTDYSLRIRLGGFKVYVVGTAAALCPEASAGAHPQAVEDPLYVWQAAGLRREAGPEEEIDAILTRDSRYLVSKWRPLLDGGLIPGRRCTLADLLSNRKPLLYRGLVGILPTSAAEPEPPE